MKYTKTFDEAMEFLGASRSTVYRWVQEGKLPAKKIGREWRFADEELRRFRDGDPGADRLADALKALSEFFRQRIKPEKRGGKAMESATLDTFEKLAEATVWDALDRNATDIHLQPRKDGVHLCYRVNGGLDDVRVIEVEAAGALGAAWEKMSQPLGGHGDRRMFLSRPSASGTTDVQIFIQALETLQGKRTTLRVVASGRVADLERVSPKESDRKTFERWLAVPKGILLFAGKPGSGKTTTMLSCLQYLARDKAKAVFSLEHPVYVRVDGVDQIEVDGDSESAVDEALKRILRMAPNVLGISLETPGAARQALQAAQCGHLVLMQIDAASTEEARQKFEKLSGQTVTNEIVGICWQKLVKAKGGSGQEAEYQFE